MGAKIIAPCYPKSHLLYNYAIYALPSFTKLSDDPNCDHSDQQIRLIRPQTPSVYLADKYLPNSTVAVWE